MTYLCMCWDHRALDGALRRAVPHRAAQEVGGLADQLGHGLTDTRPGLQGPGAGQTKLGGRWSCGSAISAGSSTARRPRCRSACASGCIAGELPELMLLLEHPPVYTVGRRSDAGDLPFGEAFYRERGIDVVRTPRGGQLTYHGPGQLVGYPIMRVAQRARVHPHDGARDRRRAGRRGRRGAAPSSATSTSACGSASARSRRSACTSRTASPRTASRSTSTTTSTRSAGSWPAGCPRCR